MFFTASKILSFLLDPFFWILVILMLALFSKKKYKRKKRLWMGFLIFIVFSNSYIYKLTFSFWEIKSKSTIENYDYGILLGGMVNLNSSIDNIRFNSTADRLLKTIELYHNNKINKILISGASGSMMSDLVEADYIRNYLITIGIPKENIITERNSKNTYENAKYSAQIILKETNLEAPTCLLITSDYHMRRSLACFNNTGLKVDPYVLDLESKYFDLESLIIPQSYILAEWKKLTHEIIGYLAYSFSGYL